ncbi:hypothetical protein Bbelb_298210 [Branchiostoma belcheri]|nr:hypothetical protein Bbelb_298210 [Branchiostoma belcheri]
MALGYAVAGLAHLRSRPLTDRAGLGEYGNKEGGRLVRGKFLPPSEPENRYNGGLYRVRVSWPQNQRYLCPAIGMHVPEMWPACAGARKDTKAKECEESHPQSNRGGNRGRSYPRISPEEKKGVGLAIVDAVLNFPICDERVTPLRRTTDLWCDDREASPRLLDDGRVPGCRALRLEGAEAAKCDTPHTTLRTDRRLGALYLPTSHYSEAVKRA